jgi:hypothetical protein
MLTYADVCCSVALLLYFTALLLCSFHLALLLYCFALLCFTTALVHTPPPGYYCRGYRAQDKQVRWFRSALLCFTLLYSALLCFTLRHYCGYRSQDKQRRRLHSALLCFTLLYSALLWLTSADTGRKTKASALLALCSTSSFRRSEALSY